MADIIENPKDSVTFYCSSCKFKFKGKPDIIQAAPEDDVHPFLYFKNCPICEQETPQAYWERNLLKAWSNSTGPKTAEGKAAAAENLKGHPTKEEAFRTRFNAMKHGLSAKVATYFPARPGQYPHCEGCEFLDSVCEGEIACLKRTELFFQHHIAFETKDPSKLMGLRADTQAAFQGMINDMFLAIAQDGGPRIKEPVWYHDKDGGFHMAGYTDEFTNQFVQYHEIKAHPLLKLLIDFINKNNMTLADMEMTPKVQDEQEVLKGFLDAEKGSNQDSLEDYRNKTAEGIEKMKDLISRSQEKTNKDDVLLEYQTSESDG